MYLCSADVAMGVDMGVYVGVGAALVVLVLGGLPLVTAWRTGRLARCLTAFQGGQGQMQTIEMPDHFTEGDGASSGTPGSQDEVLNKSQRTQGHVEVDTEDVNVVVPDT